MDAVISKSRAMFYKKPIKKDNYNLSPDNIDTAQEVRRQSLLKFQKESRDTSFNVGRGLLEEACNSDNEFDDEVMEIDKQYKNKSSRYRRNKKYANLLMMSEWMFEVPHDLLDKWIAVPCPHGKRTLVVACKGTTKAYDKRGRLLAKFDSALPGGSTIGLSIDSHRSCTILDCIWVKDREIYVVLDVLAWSNQSFTNCDTEFRSFWLKSRFQERIELQIEFGTSINKYRFLLAPSISCSNLSMGLQTLPIEMPYDDLFIRAGDGILFYHKEAHYTKGRTPLVTWLKPFMLPEIFSIDVPIQWYETPMGYIDYRHYIQSTRDKKKKQVSENQVEMTDLCD